MEVEHKKQNWWQRYKRQLGKGARQVSKGGLKDLAYWRDTLYVEFITYGLPIGLLALIPSLYMSIKEGVPIVAFLGSLAYILAVFISLNARIPFILRKVFIVGVLYVLSFSLIVLLGTFGAGIMYLITTSIFASLIFPAEAILFPVVLTGLTFLFFGWVIYTKAFPTLLSTQYSVGDWVAYSSSVLFLNTVCVILIQKVFNGLEQTIIKKNHLQSKLQEKSDHLAKMLAALQYKNQELEQFAYIASHDLQEPLRTTSALVDNLTNQYKGKLDQEADIYLQFLAQATNRMRALITGLLDYSRIGKEKEHGTVNCDEIWQEVAADLAAAMADCGAKVQAKNLPVIQGNSLELKQLFQNLLSNALKFRKNEITPEIVCAAERENDFWVFSLQDNGIGIEPKFFEKIFVIFQRLHPKATYDGTGIGLAHCRKIVDLHGGKIWVEPNPNGGSIFKFTLPAL